MVVSNNCYFHPYLGKFSNLTNIFQMGWFNHQLNKETTYFDIFFFFQVINIVIRDPYKMLSSSLVCGVTSSPTYHPVRYTEKVDCWSAGVIMCLTPTTLTRNDDPKRHMRTDWRSGTGEFCVVVVEASRTSHFGKKRWQI